MIIQNNMNQNSDGFNRIKEVSLNFVRSMKIGDKPGIYRKEAGEGESFYGSYHAAHILDLFGELVKLPVAEKEIWAANFIARQTRQGYLKLMCLITPTASK